MRVNGGRVAPANPHVAQSAPTALPPTPGGIMKCDVIASGIVNAAKQVRARPIPVGTLPAPGIAGRLTSL